MRSEELLVEVQPHEKRQANLRKAEEMLVRYIQERKKPMAELALETLLELDPDHPRRHDFEIWVRDLDQEVALQRQFDEHLGAGRAALQAGDVAGAEERLEKLRQLDPDATETEQLAAELSRAERGRAAVADIERSKQRVEELLQVGDADRAEAELKRLAAFDVPKITLDFLRKRLMEVRAEKSDAQVLVVLEAQLRDRLTSQDWQGAREEAHRVGELFRTSPRAVEMINEINQREAEHRREASLARGIASFEQFLAEGKMSDAQLTLKLLQSLKLDPARLEELAARLR